MRVSGENRDERVEREIVIQETEKPLMIGAARQAMIVWWRKLLSSWQPGSRKESDWGPVFHFKVISRCLTSTPLSSTSCGFSACQQHPELGTKPLTFEPSGAHLTKPQNLQFWVKSNIPFSLSVFYETWQFDRKPFYKMFQNLLAFHLGNFAHDLISYWNFSAVPRDSQGLGKLGPPLLVTSLLV